MAVEQVRNIAPFINDVFTVTSKWWTVRWGELHRGLDIATRGSKPVYSMLNGKIHSKGTTSSAGNWVIVVDDTIGSSTYGYATRYLHLVSQPTLPVGAFVRVGDYLAMEGQSGVATGIHLHVEMQDISRFNWQWHTSNTQSDYLDPTLFMGIDNIEGTQWIYDGTPTPTPTENEERKHFKWVLYAEKLRKKDLQ